MTPGHRVDTKLGEDSSIGPGLIGIDRQWLLGDEVLIPFNGQTEWAAEGGDLLEGDVAQFREAQTEVAQAEQSVRVVGVNFGNEPSCCAVRREQFDDRMVVIAVGKRIDEKLDVVGNREEAGFGDHDASRSAGVDEAVAFVV